MIAYNTDDDRKKNMSTLWKITNYIQHISKIYRFFFFLGAFFVLFFVFSFIKNSNNTSLRFTSCESYTHHYINPELDCINTDLAYEHIRVSEEQTRTFIDKEINAGHASRISVFFRDINTKRWYGVNENETFSPGSTLKLPLAIAYFKYQEFDPNINKLSFIFDQPNTLNSLEYFSSAEPLVVGGKYTVNDFLSRLLVDSDNAVIPILMAGIDKDFYHKVLIDLGVSIPLPEYGGIHADFFSTKSYAAIFRLLYNASYLNIEQSENILNLLSQSTFSGGIVAGVPSNIKIAHKFGEATQVDQETQQLVKRELHDCGIVYSKNNPYILCIMTEGKDFDSLKNIIKSISKIIWDTNSSEEN